MKARPCCRIMIEHIKTQTAHQLENSEHLQLTEFAGDLAQLAAGVILPYFRVPLLVEDKPGQLQFDPVTIADKAAESAMRDLIQKYYPAHGILGEEHGHQAGEQSLTWVLDPIDGTRAFITGLPLWGTLIALFDGVNPVIGVMDQPVMQERYIGNKFTSVCLQHGVESTLATRQCRTLADAIMMSTSPDMFTGNDEQQVYKELAAKIRMSRFGGDCYAYCMLARGFVDLVVEADLQPYDIQALIPIVQGAGGVVTNWSGESAAAGGQVIAAGTPELHRQALEILQAAAG